jgi:hypothetical protein
MLTILKEFFGRQPLWVSLLICFVFLTGTFFGMVALMPSAKNLGEICQKKCHPRIGNLVPDKARPPNAKNPSYVCECS